MSSINSVNSRYLATYTDQEIREKIADKFGDYAEKVFPGASVSEEFSGDLSLALREAGADFLVEKHPLFAVNDPAGLSNPDAQLTPVASHMAAVRTDTMQTLGVVGKSYGVVQTADAMESLGILAARGDVQIKNVHTVDNGARVRVAALLGESVMESASGAPNTLANFGLFEASHDGTSCVTATVYTVRLECFNGMTSREVIQSHKLRHTSKVHSRIEQMTTRVLESLIGDVETQNELFRKLIERPMGRADFTDFATELLGGELPENPSKRLVTVRERELAELESYFGAGNEGAGQTAWGAYNSVTRWLEAKREQYANSIDAAKAAKKFESNLRGQGQKKVSKALRLLTRW